MRFGSLTLQSMERGSHLHNSRAPEFWLEICRESQRRVH